MCIFLGCFCFLVCSKVFWVVFWGSLKFLYGFLDVVFCCICWVLLVFVVSCCLVYCKCLFGGILGPMLRSCCNLFVYFCGDVFCLCFGIWCVLMFLVTFCLGDLFRFPVCWIYVCC